ncbi:poly-beta-1,6 N-acetyl-D-glucosamine export porin PgaA [Pseudoxanthomonas beigongshangi]
MKRTTLSWALACALGTAGMPAAASPQDSAAATGDGNAYATALDQAAHLRDQSRWLDALQVFERLQSTHPDDDQLYRLRTLTLGDIGNSYRAWTMYRARPELFDAGQRERFEANYLARLILWSQAYPENERNRLAEARVADAAIEDYLRLSPANDPALPTRIRYDRLLVLSKMGRHQQVVDEYRALGDTVPAYALPAVGDSLMALKRPVEAAPVLEAALKADPDNSDVRMQLAYAYLESEQPTTAIRQLEAYRETQPAWLYAPGARQGSQNWHRADADSTLAMLRAFSEDLPTAEREITDMLGIGPNNAGLQTSLGQIYMIRGWPERALERFRMASTLDDRDVNARVGQVEALVTLRHDDEARDLHDLLVKEYGDQPNVQRMDELWRNHRGWQWRAYVAGARSRGGTGNTPFGNRDGEYGVEVQSPLIDDRWRLTAAVDDRWADFDRDRIHQRRQGVGVRYAYDRLDTHLGVYHSSDRVGGTGIGLDVGWRFSDTLDGRLSLRRKDADASLQARDAGITADSAAVSLVYGRNERTEFRGGLTHWRYEDGNRRTALNLDAQQRLFTRPHFLLDGLAGVSASRASREDTPYFNPSRDGTLELGLRADQLVWREYERHFRHRFTATAGRYWQEGFGTAWVPSLRYEHEWQFGLGRVLTYGINWSRPVYDGVREERFGFDAELRWGE